MKEPVGQDAESCYKEMAGGATPDRVMYTGTGWVYLLGGLYSRGFRRVEQAGPG